MKIINKNWILLAVFLLMVGCNRSAKGYNINKVINAKNGWLADSVYQISFVGEWDKERYFPEGAKKELGKIPKSAFELRSESEATIFSRLNNSFYARLKELAQDQFNIEVSDVIINEAIFRNLKGVKIKKKIIEKAYSTDHNAYLLVQFEYPQLRTLFERVTKDVAEIVKQEEEEQVEVINNIVELFPELAPPSPPNLAAPPSPDPSAPAPSVPQSPLPILPLPVFDVAGTNQ